jgi:hypothetical protein
MPSTRSVWCGPLGLLATIFVALASTACSSASPGPDGRDEGGERAGAGATAPSTPDGSNAQGAMSPGGTTASGDAASSGGVTGATNCTALTAEPYENNEGNDTEFTAKFFPTRNRSHEYIDMFYRSGASGTFRYGEGKNADLESCDQCLFMIRNGKRFYAMEGTITIDPRSKPMKTSLYATLSKLKLIEITVSPSYHSIPVPGGECVTLEPATIAVAGP